MNTKHLLVGAVSGTIFFALSALPALAETLSVNFEHPPYNPGIINGQDGWMATGSAGSGCALYDEAVVPNIYGFPTFGLQAFRISDAVTSGCFGDQAFAKPLTDAVGETGATAGTFSVGTRQTHFEMQFDLASAVPTAQQPGMHLSVSPDRGDGSRMSYLRFEDGATGIDAFFDDVQGTTNPANFVETQIATGLDRSKPHTVKLTMDVVEGPSNDVVKVWIDGKLVHTGTSWENYYRYDAEASAEQSPRVVKTALFRSSGTPTPADAGKGFLIDNLTLSSSTPKDHDGDDHGKDHDHDQKENKKASGELQMKNPKQKIAFEVTDAKDPKKDNGHVEYWNYEYAGGVLHYKAKVLCTTIKGDDARFLFQIPSGWPGLTGLYVVATVHDGGKPGIKGDTYGHAATADLTTAMSWCQTGTGFAPAFYPVTGGNLEIHH